MTRDQWLPLIAPCALKMEQLFGTPAHVMVAHSAVECGWGDAIIGKHNHFGITLAERHKLSAMAPTKEAFTPEEARWWRAKYPDRPLSDSYIDKDGIKRFYGKIGNKTIYKTVRPFADYPTLEDAARDWVSIVTGERGGQKKVGNEVISYQGAWLRYRATNDWKAWCKRYLLVYATAGHADLVVQIAEQRNVMAALEAAA